ncbi:MAG: tetratricopeptide repeat protein [Synergistaceae bacterium]|nr:tetratricopeptide repeat protein [Synergistaceae bacterium]
MEIKRPFKYNPSFLSEEDLLDSFCVRESELEILMSCIRGNTGDINQHLLLIGIRGSGKTTLLRRVAAEIKRDGELSSKWHPLLFSEENYEILNLDDLWMQSLYYLEPEAPGYDELKSRGSRDPYSEDIGLSRLLDFADVQNKRILLLCENMQDMLSVVPEKDAWKLRGVLQTERRIMLLGSATARFDQIENYKQPFYEFFKIVTLDRMPQSDCKILWEKVTGNNISDVQARALQILTGGQPRLLSVIAWFGKELSFMQLMRNLEALIDDHTEYFKGHMETLPPKERKVFATLARLWTASSSSEVAREARMEQTETSSLINRLVNRGAVEEFLPDKKTKRAKQYQLTERLYNIYYLMRVGGKYSIWVKPIVEFLAQVFGKEILEEELKNFDSEKSDAIDIKNHQMLISIFRPFDALDIRDIGENSADIRKMNEEVSELFENRTITQESLEKALATLDRSIAVLGEEHMETARSYFNIGVLYNKISNYEKAHEHYDKALHICEKLIGEEHPNIAATYSGLANAYTIQRDYAKALEYNSKALEIAERTSGVVHLDTAMIYNNIAIVYADLGKYEKAIEYNNKALIIKERILGEEHPNTAEAYNNIALVYFDQGKYEKALELYSKALGIYEKTLGDENPNIASIYDNLAIVFRKQGEYEKAIEYHGKALMIREKVLGEGHPDNAIEYNNIAGVYLRKGDYAKALEYFDKALNINEKTFGEEHPNNAAIYNNIAGVYLTEENYTKALEYYGKALKIRENILGEEHPDTFISIYNNAFCYKSMKIYDKAIEFINRGIKYSSYVLRHFDRISSLCMDIAASSRDRAQELVELIENSPSRDVLSPLVAGIKNYLGIEFRAPLEVREIAEDIKKWIEERI